MLNYPSGKQLEGVRHKFVLENGSETGKYQIIYYQYITNNSFTMIQRTL
jgi:hypothetical protein